MAIPLVVGIDGSESSPEAVDRPAAEAARHSPSLHLVHTAAGDRRGNAFALVLGSRGRRDLADMPLGAVSLAVAVRADCPGVVVRGAAGRRNGRLGNILVGVEEGEGSGTALQFALREAQVRSCRLTAVHAWNPSPRALTPQSNPSWYALEAPRRPPCHALDDAQRGMTKRYGDARASPKVSSARRAEHRWRPRRPRTCWSSAHAEDGGTRDCSRV